MKEHEKYDEKRHRADEANLQRALERRAQGKTLSEKEKQQKIRKQEDAVRKELLRLRNKENPKLDGRRGRIPFTQMPDRPPVRRINTKRKH